jgi:drug/metabolite transporter (DMT)-like permease
MATLTEDARGEDPVRGILLLVAATMFFSVSDATAKYLTGSLPVIEIGFIRYVVFTALAAFFVARAGRASARVRNPALQVARGLGLLGSALFFIFGLRFLPMAEAASISFISPLLITVLSVPLLGETVGVRRWAAVVVGLVGMLVIVRPGSDAFQPAAGLAALSSLCWALAIVLTRKMAGVDRTATTLLWSAGTGLVVLTVLLPFDMHMPTGRELALCILVGFLSSAGQGLVVLAYRHAAASLLAPFSYGQLIWSAVAGYAIFAAVPDRWTLVGAAIIIASGLYTAQRERARIHARPVTR